MRLSKKSSTAENDRIIDEVRENVLAIVDKIARSAQKQGLRVSVSELVELSKLLTIYAELRQGLLTRDDILFVTCSILCKRPEDKKRVIRVLESMLSQGSEKNNSTMKDILLGIRSDLEKIGATPGSRVHLHSSNEGVQAAYARLQLLGIIRSKGRTKYVLPEKSIKRIAKQLARESNDYRGAVAKAISERKRSDFALSLAARLGTELPYYLDLNKLGIRELMRIYRYAKSKSLRNHIARVIDKKLSSLSELSDAEARLLWDILSREKALRYESISKLIALNPRLVDFARKRVSEEELLDMALGGKGFEREARIEVATRLLRIPLSRKNAVKAFFANKTLLRKLQRGEVSEEALTALSKIMEARELLLRGLVSGERAYQDYAASELEKARELVNSIRDEEVLSETRKLYERVYREVSMALSGNSYAVLKSLVKDLSPAEALKMLNDVANSPDPRLRSQALRLMYIIVRRQIGYANQGRRERKDIGSGYGRISTRHTLLNLVRLKSRPVSVLKYRKLKSIVLVIDKSGSMKDYAIATLLSASALIPLVKRVVFFDENVYVVNTLSRSNIRRLFELVLSTRFSGYTNIISALKEATKGTSVSKLILVSDLEQTIKPYSGEDVCEYMRKLRDIGWGIVVLTPTEHYPRCFNEINVRIHVVHDISDIRRALSRI